jgi:hypothetical protein
MLRKDRGKPLREQRRRLKMKRNQMMTKKIPKRNHPMEVMMKTRMRQKQRKIQNHSIKCQKA